MLSSTLLILSAILPTGGTDLTLTAPLAVTAGVGDAYDELAEAYEAAHDTWRAKIKAAENLKERKALRGASPVAEYWPRFEALAAEGEGEALLWMVLHVREKGVKSAERGEVMRPLFERLVKDYSSEFWFRAVPEELYKQRRYVGEAEALALLASIDEGSEEDEIRAVALFNAARILQKTESEESAKRVAALYERIETEFADTRVAADVKRIKMAELTAAGKEAPDFDGKTIDGFEFKLSEYRGKVVMLDFYGFW